LVKIHEQNQEAVYLGFEGPSMLSFNYQQLKGQGTKHHPDGFGSPVGKIKGVGQGIENMSEGELEANGIKVGDKIGLEFESGIRVSGILLKITRELGKNLIFTFKDCTVIYKGNQLFKPDWGIYDMAIGKSIVSTFAGPADPDAFHLEFPAPVEKTHHILHSNETIQLYGLYGKIQEYRENAGNPKMLIETYENLKTNYPDEWLLPLEILEEIVKSGNQSELAGEIISFLNSKALENDEMQKLIEDGLALITNH
jgi:phenylalanine-4-hydroxylase